MLLTHDQQVGAPRDFALAGRVFPVSGLTPYQLGQLEAFLKDAIPSPLSEFRALVAEGGFAPEERAELFKAAKDRMEPQYTQDGFQTGGWPPTFNSAEGQRVLFNGAGLAHFLWVVLSKHTPALTRDDAATLAPHLTVSDLARLSELISVANPGADETTDSEAPRDDLPAGYVDPNA